MIVTRLNPWQRQEDRTATQPVRRAEILRKELLMPIELVSIGGVLVAAAGGLCFFLLRRLKAAEPPHIR